MLEMAAFESLSFLLCIDAGIQKIMNLHRRRLLLTGKIGTYQGSARVTRSTPVPTSKQEPLYSVLPSWAKDKSE